MSYNFLIYSKVPKRLSPNQIPLSLTRNHLEYSEYLETNTYEENNIIKGTKFQETSNFYHNYKIIRSIFYISC